MVSSLISQDPEIMSGALCFTGTRVLVKCLFDYLEGGSALDDFLDDFPSVSRETAVAVLEAARQQLTADVLELHNFQSDLLESVKQMRRGQASRSYSVADLQYQAVPHDHKAFLAKAHNRQGFSEAYEASTPAEAVPLPLP